MRRAVVIVSIVTVLAFPVWGQVINYRHDDGIPENAVGPTVVGVRDFIWLNRFLRHPIGPRITSIEVSFGLGFEIGLEVGSPVEVLLYDDPTGEDPRDAVLVRHQAATVQTVEFASFNTFPIDPVVVSGFFHVGVILRNQPGFTFPAAYDFTPPHASGFSTAGTFNGTIDVTNLASIPPENFGTIEDLLGHPGNWLIRANGVPIPEPVGLMIPIGLALLSRRPRR
jgi:hypothetical protein